MNVQAIYNGSDGDATKALYADLEKHGPAGLVALNLFRACKCSSRAKGYSRRYKGEAYGRKQWSMRNLCDILGQHGEALGISWGWMEDPDQPFHNQVLYIDIPTGQVSFHTDVRGKGPDYYRSWDGVRDAAHVRICQWVQAILDGSPIAEGVPVAVAPMVKDCQHPTVKTRASGEEFCPTCLAVLSPARTVSML